MAHRCEQETRHFFQRQGNDPRYCFELFRRAILERNERAWELICSQYQRMVFGWVQRHPAFPGAGEEAQYFVNGVFAKTWAALTPDRFNRFPDLKSLLRYLQMCAHSVIVDYVRQAGPSAADDQDEDATDRERAPGPAIEDQALDRVNRQEFWRWLDLRLRDEKERRVVHGSFVLGLTPRELYAQSPKTFNSIDEVYRIKENVLARLRRDPTILEILDRTIRKTG